MRRRVAALLGLAAVAAGVMTATGTRIAAQQGTTITALRADGTVPSRDPFDPFWERLAPVEIPLSAQEVTPPMGGRRFTLQARAVHDDDRLYVLVEWPDPSADRSVAAVTDFTDSVAVQFPGEAGTQVPAFCMGDPNATVNIWHWKAAWQADMEEGFGGTKGRYPNAAVDDYPFGDEEVFAPGRAAGNQFSVHERESAVENLVAAGFGSLTPDQSVAVTGWGQWRDGRWRVVFERTLAVAEPGNVNLPATGRTDVAFAVWDGGARERDGQKSVANFVTLDVSDRPMPAGPSGLLVGLLIGLIPLAVGAAVWAGVALGRRALREVA